MLSLPYSGTYEVNVVVALSISNNLGLSASNRICCSKQPIGREYVNKIFSQRPCRCSDLEPCADRCATTLQLAFDVAYADAHGAVLPDGVSCQGTILAAKYTVVCAQCGRQFQELAQRHEQGMPVRTLWHDDERDGDKSLVLLNSKRKSRDDHCA